MNPDTLVIVGLAVDGAGAIAVLVPELPFWREILTPLLPRIGSIFRARKELLSTVWKEPDSEQLVGLALQIQPAVDEYLLQTPAPRKIQRAKWDAALGHERTGEFGSRSLRLYGKEDTTPIADWAQSEIHQAARGFIDRRYRRWGVIALGSGFLLQFLGQVCG